MAPPASAGFCARAVGSRGRRRRARPWGRCAGRRVRARPVRDGLPGHAGPVGRSSSRRWKAVDPAGRSCRRIFRSFRRGLRGPPVPGGVPGRRGRAQTDRRRGRVDRGRRRGGRSVFPPSGPAPAENRTGSKARWSGPERRGHHVIALQAQLGQPALHRPFGGPRFPVHSRISFIGRPRVGRAGGEAPSGRRC